MKYFVYFSLLYFIGGLEFLGSTSLLTACHFFYLFICIGALGYHILCKQFSIITFFLCLYCFIFPIYASYQSNHIFGQPFLMGFASLRYLWFILFGLLLYNAKYNYNLLLKQINNINIIVAVVSFIALYLLGIDHVQVQSFMTSTDTIEIVKSEDLVKGSKLTVCSSLMIVSYLYYMLKVMQHPTRKKNLLPFIVLMIYLLFVHKGRQPLVLLAVVYAVFIMRMKGVTYRRLILSLVPIIGCIVLATNNNSTFDSVMQATKFEQSEDSSTLARVSSIMSVIPYIQEYPVLGFGNLSSHFRDEGFHTYFGDTFYIADIGIWGAIARGGLVLLLIYFGIYYHIYKQIKKINDSDIRMFLQYMILSLIFMLVILCNDRLYGDGCIIVALLYYPLYGKKDPNIFIQQSAK